MALVEDPASTDYSDVPRTALALTEVDFVGDLAQLAVRTNELAARLPESSVLVPPDLQAEVEMTERDSYSQRQLESFGELTRFTCPSCGWSTVAEGRRALRGLPLRGSLLERAQESAQEAQLIRRLLGELAATRAIAGEDIEDAE